MAAALPERVVGRLGPLEPGKSPQRPGREIDRRFADGGGADRIPRLVLQPLHSTGRLLSHRDEQRPTAWRRRCVSPGVSRGVANPSLLSPPRERRRGWEETRAPQAAPPQTLTIALVGQVSSGKSS